jgi:hypothetical protein
MPNRTTRTQRRLAPALGFAAALLALIAGAPLGPSVGASQSTVALAVIANTGVPERHLDIDALRAVFLRKRLQWANGQHVIPLNYPAGHSIRLAFDRAVLGFGAGEAARYWIDARIRFGTQAPRTVAADAMLVRVVAQLPGCISYVPSKQVPAAAQVVARIEGGRVLAP